MSDNNTSSPRVLSSVLTATKVIEGLASLDGAGVTELAEYLELSKSTTYAHLQTLMKAQLVIKEKQKYHLATRFLTLGEYVRNNILLYQLGHKEVAELAEEIGHYAHLVIEENGRGITIQEEKGKKAVDYEYQRKKLQQSDPLHVTASGKAILAFLPEHRVNEIIDRHGLEQRTNKTITDREHLLKELDKIQDRGYARNDQEEINGFRAVAAPVCAGEVVHGSVVVGGPVSDFTNKQFQETLPEKVRSTAKNIEVSINMWNQSGT